MMVSATDRCPECNGTGLDDGDTCTNCRGTGHKPLERENNKPLFIS